jgi:hypothetical protein
MLQAALPEGVLDTGGHVAGFIYFQKLPQGTERIQFARTHDRRGNRADGRFTRYPIRRD